MAQRTPTMGWSSWNTFALNINEDLIRQQADAMHRSGLQKAGYQYINIDDGYWDGRGEDGLWASPFTPCSKCPVGCCIAATPLQKSKRNMTRNK